MTELIIPKTQVPFIGSPDSLIAMVGEAPGRVEEQRGIPFTGKAGKLLDKLLPSAGILRSKVYLGNVVLERPHHNNIDPFIKISNYGNAKTSPEYDEYERKLYKTIRECNANVIVAFGAIPLYALTRKHPITKQRGSILEGVAQISKEFLPNPENPSEPIPVPRKVIPTMHPASALPERVPLNGRLISWDLVRAKAESLTPKLYRVPRNIEWLLTPTQVSLWLEEISTKKEVFFDIEIVNRELNCLCFGTDHLNCKVIPFFAHMRNVFTAQEEYDIMLKIAEIMANPEITKVGQNFIFDMGFLYNKYGIVTNSFDDTMIAQGIIYPDFPKGLDFILSMYGEGEPYYKAEGKTYLRIGGKYEDFWRYNGMDGIATAIALPKQKKYLDKLSNKETYNWTKKLVHPLMYMQERGFKVDEEGRKEESQRLDDLCEQKEQEFIEIAGRDLNIASAPQMIDYFYNVLKVKPIIRDKTSKRPTTNEEALKKILAKGYEEARPLLEFRKFSKLNSTYYKAKTLDGRMRCFFNPVGTETLRLSSGKNFVYDTGCNMQTLPHPYTYKPDTPEEYKFDIKKYLIADENCGLINIDLRQAENMIIAFILHHFLDDSKMWNAFRDGTDLHSLTASAIFNKPYEEISRKEGSSSLGSGSYSERFWGKKANHALNYGMGYILFAHEYELSYKEAKRIVDAFHNLYPGIKRYYKWISRKLWKDRSITNFFGFTRRFMDSPTRVLKSAYATIPQSMVPAIINRRGIIHQWENQELYQFVECLNQVHDSMVNQISFDMPWSYWKETMDDTLKSLETPIVVEGEGFVIPADIEMGLNLGEMIEFNEENYNKLKQEVA